MSKVIHDYSSMIEEATKLILEDNRYIYPYTGDLVIDEIFSRFTCETDPENDNEIPAEDKILYKLLNIDQEILEEDIKNTIFDLEKYSLRTELDIKFIKHYLKKENRTLEETLYLFLESCEFGFLSKDGKHKVLPDFINKNYNI